MTGKNIDPSPQPIEIGWAHWELPVQVSRNAFTAFGRKLEEDLDKLVARWIHAAAPNAWRTQRRSQ